MDAGGGGGGRSHAIQNLLQSEGGGGSEGGVQSEGWGVGAMHAVNSTGVTSCTECHFALSLLP